MASTTLASNLFDTQQLFGELNQFSQEVKPQF